MNIPKKQNIVISNLCKAYVEGIYNDSPLNRKLGRVGMSYKEYINSLKERGEYQEEHIIKKEKNKIPINIADLDFDKEGKAHYEVDGKKIDIQLVSHIKHGEKNFTLKVDDKEYTNLNTTQLTRKLKSLARGDSDFTNSSKLMSDKIPITPEEFDKLYGDIGFNYTYYKDNLDIKVWIREDSNKKDPRFNIYVVDNETKKRKSFTNLSLLQAHNKLLEYDLNPDIEKPLSKQQLKEFRNIQRKQGIKVGEDEEIKFNKDLGFEFDKFGKALFKIDGGFISLNLSKENPSLIGVSLIDENGSIQGVDYTDINNLENLMNDYNLEIGEKNQTDQIINSKGQIVGEKIDKPLKDIIENYIDKDTLQRLNGDLRFSDFGRKYLISPEDEEKLSQQIRQHKLGYLSGQKKDWNKDKREGFTFVNSKKFINWLDDMPFSKKEGVTKKQIYKEVKEFVDRLSPMGDLKYETSDNKTKYIDDAQSIQSYIIDKYY